MKQFDVDDLLVLVLMALVILFFIPGCGCPGDSVRVVNPVTWRPLGAAELQERCGDARPGCVISGPDGDVIYMLKPDVAN